MRLILRAPSPRAGKNTKPPEQGPMLFLGELCNLLIAANKIAMLDLP
jgi:hypothetical protein